MTPPIKYTGADVYQIPSVHEVVNKAMYVYNHRSPIDAATDPIRSTIDGSTQQLLFPFMNFTCNNSITRLMFVARKINITHESGPENAVTTLTSWPMFSLWHHEGGSHFRKMRNINNIQDPLQIATLQPPGRVLIGDGEVGAVVINFTVPVMFEAGNILGLRQNTNLRLQNHNKKNTLNTSIILPNLVSYSMTVLGQSGGYGLALTCGRTTLSGECAVTGGFHDQVMPYIAIETCKSLSYRQCVIIM